MTIKYRTFENVNGSRRNIFDYDTEEEAIQAVEENNTCCKDNSVYFGYHKYYLMSRKEYDNEVYTGTSINNPDQRTWMINEGAGCVLLFEGLHFDII